MPPTEKQIEDWLTPRPGDFQVSSAESEEVESLREQLGIITDANHQLGQAIAEQNCIIFNQATYIAQLVSQNMPDLGVETGLIH